MFAHKLFLGYIESMTWSCENLCLWLYSCLYAKNVIIVFRLKYTFGPYFCCFYSIWSLFSFYVQL